VLPVCLQTAVHYVVKVLQVCTVAESAAFVCTGCDSLYIRDLSLRYLMHLRVQHWTLHYQVCRRMKLSATAPVAAILSERTVCSH